MDTGTPEIIFFGRLEERKGLLEFVDAIVALAAAHAGDFTVTFLGKDVRLFSARAGRVQSSEYVERKLSRTGLRFQILPDFSSAEAIARVRSSPSCVVCLASPNDNFPNAGLEMAQVPVPLVASDTTAFHQTLELAGRREGVFWFQPASAQSLREALRRALAAAGTRIKVPKPEAIEAINDGLATRRFRLIEDAFAANRSPHTPSAMEACVVVLGGDDPAGAETTLDSLEESVGTVCGIHVVGEAEWSGDDLARLKSKSPRASFTTSDDIRAVLADAPAGCDSLVLVCIGAKMNPGTVSRLLEARARSGAVLVTSAEWDGPGRTTARSFQPGCASLLLRANNTSGSCVLVSREFVESLPPLTARTGPLVIWQITLAAAITGAKTAYIPYPEYQSLGKTGNVPGTAADLALLARYAAAIDSARWARRELFALCLTAQQLDESLRRAQEESSLHCGQLAEAQAVLSEARGQLAQCSAELAAVYCSKSWRMTAALRGLYKVLRACFPGT